MKDHEVGYGVMWLSLPKPTTVQPTYNPYTQQVGRFRASKGKFRFVRLFYNIFNNSMWAGVSADGRIDYGKGPVVQKHLR
jgi:hypothetical protein